jgi:hypothetical protein
VRVNCGVIANGSHAEAKLCRSAWLKGIEREGIRTQARPERRATARWLDLSSVCRARVEANPKNRGSVDCSSLIPEGRAAARRLGLLSNGWAKEHTSKKKREKRERRCLLQGRVGDFYTRVQGKIQTSKSKSETIRGGKKW